MSGSGSSAPINKQDGTTTGITSGTTTGTNITGAVPYGKGKQILDTSLTDALNLYKGGKLNPYVGMSTTTRTGLNNLNNAAAHGAGSLSSALSTFTNMAKGGGDISSAPQTDIAGKAMGPSYAEQNLAGVARGDMLNKSDPNFERLLSSAKDSAATAARMSAGGMGRYGGDFAQTEVGRTVGDLEASQRYKQMNDERTRQVEANSLMDSMRHAGLGIGLNATNSASSIDAANNDRRMSAAGAVPGAYDATLNPYRTSIDVGHAYDADTANRLGNKGANLSSLQQILQSISPYGTTTNTQNGTTKGVTSGTTNSTGSTQNPDNWAKWLGGGIGGLSFLKQLGVF